MAEMGTGWKGWGTWVLLRSTQACLFPFYDTGLSLDPFQLECHGVSRILSSLSPPISPMDAPTSTYSAYGGLPMSLLPSAFIHP
jgi:hypothetical protein